MVAASPATYDRDLMLKSVEAQLWLQALLYKHLATEVVREFGPDAGTSRLARGLRAYGQWRGEALAKRLPERAAARDIVDAWDSADLLLPVEKGYEGGGFRPGGDVAEVSIVSTPEWTEWRDLEDKSLARLYYVETLAGIAEGFGRGLKIEHPKFGPNLKSLWTIRLTVPGADSGRGPIEHSTLDDRDASLALLRATTRQFAALYYFLARDVMAGPSLSGEKAVREATRAFAVDRAHRLRARHEAEGKPINLKTMTDDYDLPKVSLWRYDEKRSATNDSQMVETCVFCPYAEVWRELDGLDIGYIYDYEFHLNIYQAYLPGTIADFDGVQTRGDAVCNFRFRAPVSA